MGKNKLLTISLAVIILALCMAIYYTQRRLNVMRINFNRSDRELAMLKEDYNRLYEAYYKFDDKIKLIISQNRNAYWSADSTAYLIGSNPQYYFGFINKPTMKTEFYLWKPNHLSNPNGFLRLSRVDTIKPHQLVNVHADEGFQQLIIAPTGSKTPDIPDLTKVVTEIKIN